MGRGRGGAQTVCPFRRHRESPLSPSSETAVAGSCQTKSCAVWYPIANRRPSGEADIAVIDVLLPERERGRVERGRAVCGVGCWAQCPIALTIGDGEG